VPERAANIGQSRVVNDTTVQIVWMLMAMTGWAARVVDVNSAFLHGEQDDNTLVFMEVTKGFWRTNGMDPYLNYKWLAFYIIDIYI